MSGVEAAGFVLAAIPLLISACEHYAEGVSTIKRWHRYKTELKQIRVRLGVEYAIFRDTCEKLLDGLVHPEDLEDLINDPGGIAWSDGDLGYRLEKRLQRSYHVYLESVEELTAAVKYMQDELGLDVNGKPLSGGYHMLKHEYKRLKFSLSHRERGEVMERIGKNNTALAELTNNSRLLEPSRRSRRFPSKQFRSIQQHANNVYTLIKRRWTCNCGTPHDANLHLNPRLSGLEKLPAPSLDHRHVRPQDSINFKVAFSISTVTTDTATSWSWQETEIRALNRPIHASSNQEMWKPLIPERTSERHDLLLDPMSTLDISSTVRANTVKTKKGVRFASSSLESVTADLPTLGVEKTIQDIKDLVHISNICHTLQNSIARTAYSHQCLGILCDEGHQPLGIYLAGSSTAVPKQCRIVSLAELLERNAHRPEHLQIASGARTIYKGDRLRIALTVASSVLQLYKTPWLRKDWNKHDILIDESGDTYGDQAYVSGAFSTAATARQEGQRQMMYDLVRNETLFSLGILLIELCLGQSFESLRSPEDPLNAQKTPDIFTDWSAANRLLGSVYGEAGARYGDATRRCIRCEFDERETTLDNENLRQKFYDGVIIPLEDDVKAFEGKPIDGMI